MHEQLDVLRRGQGPIFAAHNQYHMPQDSGARLKAKRKATLKLIKRKAEGTAKPSKRKRGAKKA